MVSPAEEAFERWLIQEDVLLKGCSLGPNPAAVRGVIADWSHPAGQTIVSVPDELVLMPHTSRSVYPLFLETVESTCAR